MDPEANHVSLPSSAHDVTRQSEAREIDQHMNAMRSRISDLGHEIDSRKAAVARSMGGAVFLLILAAGAAYDLVTRNTTLSVALGVTRETLTGIALGCGLAALALLAHAIVRAKFSDQSRDAELAGLEEEYADLLERKDSVSKAES